MRLLQLQDLVNLTSIEQSVTTNDILILTEERRLAVVVVDVYQVTAFHME